MDIGASIKVGVITVVLQVFVVMGLVTMTRLCIIRNKTITGSLIRLSLVMNLLSGTANLVGLLVGTIQGTWTLGNTACQLVGLTNLVLTSGATWIMAIAAVERYFRFLLASDHPSTFSQKNVNILVAGMYVLIILVATGPLYGLGEYTNFRGHVTLTIMANSTIQNISHADKMADERFHVTLLHRATVIGKIPDPIPWFVKHLEQDYGMTTSRFMWMDRGLCFLLRAWTQRHALSFWSAYQADGLRSQLTRHLWQQELLWSARMEHLDFVAHLDQDEYRRYVDIYVPLSKPWSVYSGFHVTARARHAMVRIPIGHQHTVAPRALSNNVRGVVRSEPLHDVRV
ncbi:uncharacterized protein LOC117335357 isoform X1 [Pecten maximus]|uniref:uncharacterized protein LOC117335357 isoform X1 n=1 Tax=Pecten maximus TaxID=6579 RepID=UPI0014581F6E|nr:uncharacterized protein LOC117335357 isoform X1 [Pecten maximus]